MSVTPEVQEDLGNQMAEISWEDRPQIFLYYLMCVWITKVNVDGVICAPVGQTIITKDTGVLS